MGNVRGGGKDAGKSLLRAEIGASKPQKKVYISLDVEELGR